MTKLEHQIFEIAGLSCPKDIPTLMRVSRRINIGISSVKCFFRVEPLLYRVIVLSSHDLYRLSGIDDAKSFPLVTTAELLDHITTKSPSFFGSSVTHFYFDGDIPISTLDAILGACLGIDNLGTFDFTVPLFCNITHLEIWDNYAALQAEICTGLACMPRLTHLVLNTMASVVPALHLHLLGNMCLCAIVFLVRHRPNPTPLGVDDTRFVCIVWDSYFTDWFHSATSGLDFWALADALIAARRAGKTPAVGIGHQPCLPGFPLVYLG
ncbi:hypothetical protein B0H14DRAFT_2879544 [Mycena olivaceomarginata]|nr:hypothetical protein B0H14DRAFT_2879544 [Mycena olivaceomarginata]